MKRMTVLCAALLAATSAMAQEQNPPKQPEARPDEPTKAQVRPLRVRTNDFAMAERTQKATDLMGKKVVNAANENLGKLEDIVVDASSGRIIYGVLSFGGFMGMGDKLFAIPWESLDLPADAKQFVLNVGKDRLKDAEGFDKSHWPNFADEQWATKTHTYYDVKPYWQVSKATPADDKNRTSGTYRDRWYQRPAVWQKCSDLCGKDTHNMQNEDIGRVSDCLIDPDGGRVLYGILAYSGKRYAIPWNALTLTTDAKKFQVNVTKEQLKNAPAFVGESWPNATDERWALEVHRFYRVQPYWTEVTIETGDNR
jgi:sporulation protein YlmC with PRC-barrel domain